jgi:ABC-type glycerol-3-phosphate transport system substrate-binding protein
LTGDQYNTARRDIQAGDNTYDVFSIALQGPTARLAQEGLLMDLNHVPYIDLEKPWWDQKANEQLSIGNKLMFTISDLLIIDKDALFIFLFNKDAIKEHNLEDPYQLVREGKWTIDKMWGMAKVNSKDINGDGILDDTDSYGLLTAGHTIHGNIVSSGHFVITKDQRDMPVLNIADPMIHASYEKWIKIINDRTNTWVAQDWDSRHSDIWLYQLNVLDEKRGLFLYAGMDRVTTLRNFDCNFGILPNPKFDESQSEYYNHVHAWCTTAISIPVTSEPERTGIILEALTSESYYTLRPAYYEVSLKTKFMRDDESSEMLDLIFNTRCYDLGHVYNWGGVFDMLHGLPLGRNQDFVSAYERILPRIERDMQNAIDNFLESE